MDLEKLNNRYQSYNQDRWENFLDTLTSQQASALQAVPLLLHSNANLLPGHISRHTPYGIAAYTPQDNEVDEVKKISSHFVYDSEAPDTTSHIEALYLQDNIKSCKLIAWVIYEPFLNKQAIQLLEKKCVQLRNWLRNNELQIEFIVSSADQISNAYFRCESIDFNIDKGFFLDSFYSESILLAGKQPLWWLIESENDEQLTAAINQLDSHQELDLENYINFGSINRLRPQDYVSTAIWNLFRLMQSPEETWLNMLLLRHRFATYPEVVTVATRLKTAINNESAKPDQLDTISILADIIEQGIILSTPSADLDTIYQSLNYLAKNLDDCKQYKKQISVYELILKKHDLQTNTAPNEKDNIQNYFNTVAKLYHQVRNIFDWIKHHAAELDQELAGNNKLLDTITDNLLARTKTNRDIVLVNNSQHLNQFKQEKVVISHELIKHHKHNWSLIIPSADGGGDKVKSSNNLLRLITWSWLNHIIDPYTRISVYCPRRLILQIEVMNLLDICTQQIPENLLYQSNIEQFLDQPQAIRSFMVILPLSDQQTGKRVDFLDTRQNPLNPNVSNSSIEIQFDQAIIYNWGEVHTRHHIGYQELLDNLCLWTAETPLDSKQVPKRLEIFSISAGIVNDITLGIRDIYSNIVQYFYKDKHANGRFIQKMGSDYFLIRPNNQVLQADKLGDLQSLYKFFENPGNLGDSLYLHCNTAEELRLYDVLSLNKPGQVQLFYYLEQQQAEVYIIDDQGGLFIHRQIYKDPSSFINQWLLFFYNSRKRLAEMQSSSRLSSAFEMGELRLGPGEKYHYQDINAEMLPSDQKYYDLQLRISTEDNKHQLTLDCENTSFSSKQYGDKIYLELMRFLSQNWSGQGQFPVYLTDIDVPISMFQDKNEQDIQLADYIKYKRNIENRLNNIARNFRPNTKNSSPVPHS